MLRSQDDGRSIVQPCYELTVAFHVVRELIPGDWLASGLKGHPGQMEAHLVPSQECPKSLAGYRSYSMGLWDLPVPEQSSFLLTHIAEYYSGGVL